MDIDLLGHSIDTLQRHTASLLGEGAMFVLSVPTYKLRNLVLRIGKLTGAKWDKFSTLKLASCSPGWEHPSGSSPSETDTSPVAKRAKTDEKTATSGPGQQPTSASHPGVQTTKPKATTTPKEPEGTSRSYRLVAVSDCVCHIVCQLEKMVDEFIDGHWLLRATMKKAWVRETHWSGKNFCPKTAQGGDEDLLTFLGSQKFGRLAAPVAEG